MVGHCANQAFAVLQTRAGRYAGRIARLWPAPHEAYLGLPAARRHLAHLLTSRLPRASELDERAFVRDVEGLKTKELIARWAPGFPHGLETVLAKLGETAWTPTDYRRLLALLAEGGPGGETLRHAAQIAPLFVEALELLPPRLRGPATARWVTNPWEARIVQEAVRLAETLGAGGRVDALVERLGRARTRARFFAMLVEELRPNGLPAPVQETAELRPLRTVAEVRDAGLRFRNCLAVCVHRAVFGESAFVEWRGAEPAVMELEHEGVAGWRLLTLLGPGNQPVTPQTGRLIYEALAAQGVRTGWGARFLLEEIEMIVEDEERAVAPVAVAAE